MSPGRWNLFFHVQVDQPSIFESNASFYGNLPENAVQNPSGVAVSVYVGWVAIIKKGN